MSNERAKVVVASEYSRVMQLVGQHDDLSNNLKNLLEKLGKLKSDIKDSIHLMNSIGYSEAEAGKFAVEMGLIGDMMQVEAGYSIEEDLDELQEAVAKLSE